MKILHKRGKKVLLSLVVITVIFSGIFLLKESGRVGMWIWKTTHLAPVATIFYNDPSFLVEIGNHYFNEEESGAYDLQKAKKYFKKAIKKNERVPDAWHQLARISFLEGNYPQALFYINNQIYFHGRSLMSAYYIRGLIYGYAGEYKEAQENFIVFLQWDNKNWAAHTDLAWAYFQDGKYEDSYATAIRGLLFSPQSPWLLNMAGVSKLNVGDKKTAEHFLAKALGEVKKITPENWARSYPGNDPAIANQGLSEMITAIEKNLAKAKT